MGHIKNTEAFNHANSLAHNGTQQLMLNSNEWRERNLKQTWALQSLYRIGSSPTKILLIRVSTQWVNFIVWMHLNSLRNGIKNFLWDRLFFFTQRFFIMPALWYFSFICVKIKLHIPHSAFSAPTVIGHWPSWKWDNRYTVCYLGWQCSSTVQYFSIVKFWKQLNKNLMKQHQLYNSISYGYVINIW